MRARAREEFDIAVIMALALGQVVWPFVAVAVVVRFVARLAGVRVIRERRR